MKARQHASRLIFFLLLGFATQALGQKNPFADEWRATAPEGVLLPQFCWGQMMNIDGPPEYYIPKDCGASNHYCLGLLKIVRANKIVGHRDWKKRLYEMARDDTLYTLNGMKDFPTCPLRPHVERTLLQIQTQLKILK